MEKNISVKVTRNPKLYIYIYKKKDFLVCSNTNKKILFR